MFLLSRLFGLPAHALVVHAAVIFVPCAVLAVIVTGWSERWRRHYEIPALLLTLAGAFFAFLADQSGGPIEGKVRRAAEAAGAGRVRFGEHPDQGGTAFTFAMIFTGAVVVFFVVDRFGERITGRKPPKWTPLGMYAIVSVIGLLSLLTMVQAGHSGAALVWKDVGSYAAGK